MDDHDRKNDDRDTEMERDADIRRDTQVRDALGPIEGTDAERNAAESALAPDERAGADLDGDDVVDMSGDIDEVHGAEGRK